MSWRGETEDGLGWGGLVPTKAEREAEAREERRRRELAKLRADNAALLEALSDLYTLICDMGWSAPDNRYASVTRAAVAIAKATGEQP